MLSHTPKECRGAFLLKFTEQAIKNTKSAYLFRLEDTLKDLLPESAVEEQEKKVTFTRDELKEKIREKLKEPTKKKQKEIAKQIHLPIKNPVNTLDVIRDKKRVLRLPEPRLPPTMSYLRPTPTGEVLDLKKLNVLIQDPRVNIIECLGPNTKIVVNGSMGRKSTEMTLTEMEMEEIFDEFAKKARIPLSEGITKIVVGSLILTATKGQEQPSKFTIKKMTRNPQMIPTQR